MTVVSVEAAEPSESSFAATIAEELPDPGDRDDTEALPGAWAIDDRALHQLPTIGHVGRYALKHQLGSGGLGTVHAALDPLLSRAIAIKTLHVHADPPDHHVDAHRQAREMQLLAEARTAAGLNHPNIVTIHDAGLAEQGVYIAMERLQGRDLRELLADGWRPEPAQAARIAKCLAEALAYAHSRGVVHCDVKPANIFMVGRTQPKLLDFGIARVARPAQNGALVPDIALEQQDESHDLGSPYYAAPEQLLGAVLDPRCDVYGVGVVLYELLTGRRAFEGRSLEAIRVAVLQGDVPPVHRINRRVDVVLSSIVEKAMARDPAQRHRSAGQLVRALRTWLDEDAGREVAAPLGNGSAPWAVFAGLGLLAAFGFGMQAMGVWPPQGAAAPVQAPAAAAAEPLEQPVPSKAQTSPLAAVQAAQAAAPVRVQAAPAAAPVRTPARTPVHARAPKAAAVTPAPLPLADPSAKGVVQLAISPWGQVEVNGAAAGTTPPLARLTLPPGRHRIVVRNDDFAPFAATVQVDEDKPVTLRHRFGS